MTQTGRRSVQLGSGAVSRYGFEVLAGILAVAWQLYERTLDLTVRVKFAGPSYLWTHRKSIGSAIPVSEIRDNESRPQSR